jgi:transcriptional regulator with XRE-family HTH domain
MSKTHKAVGTNMRRARVRRLGERSLRTVARRLGIDHSTVSRWETGDTELRVADLFAYAEACGVKPEELVTGILKPPAQQLVLDLEPPVGRAVLRLVDVLKEHGSVPTRRAASAR